MQIKVNFDAANTTDDGKSQTSMCMNAVCQDGYGNNNPLRYKTVLLYEGGDSYANLTKHGKKVQEQMYKIWKHGMMVEGKHVEIEFVVSADLKALNATLGHCGCSASRPCFWCKAKLSDEDPKCAEKRTMADAIKSAHSAVPGFVNWGYKCQKCGHDINGEGEHGPEKVSSDNAKADEKKNEKSRQAWQQAHDGMMCGRVPWLWFLAMTW